MKSLDGRELADYVKERQAKQVRNLRQAYKTEPKLMIVQAVNDPVIDTYVRMKKTYGSDIQVEVENVTVAPADLIEEISRHNEDSSVHGIIVQLPVGDTTLTNHALNSVVVSKDVDGLASGSPFTPATAMAIDWLLNGYNVDVRRHKIAIVGHGKLVGAPLATLWKTAGHNVTVFDESSGDIKKKLRKFDLIVSAAGVPGLITSRMIQPGAIVIDAATSAEHGKIIGDVEDDVRERSDVTITPQKGGVGPLTVAALFDNVIRAARASTDTV